MLSRTATTATTASPIDMLNPEQTCARLCVNESELIELVNHDTLAAFRLGGELRFRYRDVTVLAARLVAA